MREEEKLARHVYRTLYAEWLNVGFSNISRAEQKYMDNLASKLEKYGLPDPVSDDTTGVLNHPVLAGGYPQLISQDQDQSNITRENLKSIFRNKYKMVLNFINRMTAVAIFHSLHLSVAQTVSIADKLPKGGGLNFETRLM